MKNVKNFSLFLTALFLFSSPVFAHGISAADKQAMIDGGYLKYIWLGATHMVTGYDHLLFLFGVIFFLTTIKQITKFITVFTVGHSITLIFATFLQINANYFLIDAVIALSVCYKGFDNVNGYERFLKTKSPNLLYMVLIFGFIHGFGLSTRLQQLPLGEDSMSILFRIISFNIGVELGQITALVGMLLLVNLWRKNKTFKQFDIISNNGLIVVGFLLFLFQLHGYLHTKYPDEMGFSDDLHDHAHIKQLIEKKVKKEMGQESYPQIEHDSF